MEVVPVLHKGAIAHVPGMLSICQDRVYTVDMQYYSLQH